MGFFGNLVQGAKVGQKAAKAEQILVQHFGISPDKSELMDMCRGYGGMDGMANFLNEYELAVYYAGNYHNYPKNNAGHETLARVIVVTQMLYQKGLAKAELAREGISAKAREMNDYLGRR